MYHRISLIADQEFPHGAVAIAPWVNCVVPRQEDLSSASQHWLLKIWAWWFMPVAPVLGEQGYVESMSSLTSHSIRNREANVQWDALSHTRGKRCRGTISQHQHLDLSSLALIPICLLSGTHEAELSLEGSCLTTVFNCCSCSWRLWNLRRQFLVCKPLGQATEVFCHGP